MQLNDLEKILIGIRIHNRKKHSEIQKEAEIKYKQEKKNKQQK